MERKQLIGSYTAKGGFKNELEVSQMLRDYKEDEVAQSWLTFMGYEPEKIRSLKVTQIPSRMSKTMAESLGVPPKDYERASMYKKADVQIRVEMEDATVHVQNLSLKKANKPDGYNQIDKRSVDTYQKMWKFNDKVARLLKLFTGEILPSEYEPRTEPKDEKRLYIPELQYVDQVALLVFFSTNQERVISDALKGRGGLKTDYLIVTEKDGDNYRWIITDIATACQFYSEDGVEVSPRGSLRIGRITMQRKGGTPDPTSLQFKFDPLDLFQLDG